MDNAHRPTQAQKPPDRALPDLAGREVAGYRIIRLIGVGGMGRVYRALDTQLGRDVAIKFVSTAVMKDPKLVERFEREVRILEKINHPNVAHIYGQGVLDGIPYFIMEYVEGVSLARLLRDGKKLPGKRCLDLLVEAARGLEAVFKQGVVHRDIKPSNLMIDATDHLKVLDFGVARRLDEDRHLTTARSILGTPRFMSPEQAVGADTDHRSDIYSLGVTFYTLFAGRAPFDSDDPAELRRLHVVEDPPQLSELNPRVPAAIEAVIHRMMAKSPADRPGSYEELIRDLHRARLGTTPAPPRAASVVSREGARQAASVWWRGRPRWLVPAAGGAGAVLLGAVLLFGGTSERTAKPQEREEVEAPADDPFGLSRALRDAFYTKTVANIRRVGANIEAYRAENGFVPDRLQDLVDDFGVPGPVLIDGWGRSLRYEHVRNGYRLSSLGLDGRRSNDDIVLEDGVLHEPDYTPPRPDSPAQSHRR